MCTDAISAVRCSYASFSLLQILSVCHREDMNMDALPACLDTLMAVGYVKRQCAFGFNNGGV
jgi:hypothetical protein